MADNEWQTRLKTGRNEDCPCGSKKKYKKCHLEADEKMKSAQLSKINAEAGEKMKAEEHDHEHDHGHHGHDHPHAHKHEKGGPARPNTSQNSTKQISAPRKTGVG